MSTNSESFTSKDKLMFNDSPGSRTVSMLLDDYNDLETLPSRDNRPPETDDQLDDNEISIQLKDAVGKAELRSIPGSIPLSSYPRITTTVGGSTKSVKSGNTNMQTKSSFRYQNSKVRQFMAQSNISQRAGHTIESKKPSSIDGSQQFVPNNMNNEMLSSVEPINIISPVEIDPSSSDPPSQYDGMTVPDAIPGDETLKENSYSGNISPGFEKEEKPNRKFQRAVNMNGEGSSDYSRSKSLDYSFENKNSRNDEKVKSAINIWKYVCVGTLAGAIIMFLVTLSVKFINDSKLPPQQKIQSNDLINAFENSDNRTRDDLLKYFMNKYDLLQNGLKPENITSENEHLMTVQTWLTGPVTGVENNFEKINPEFKNDREIQSLMKADDLKQTFYCLAYAPRGVIEPQCGATQRDILLDIARMSKVTNKIRTYGTQCNQTAMILEAIRQLHVNLTLSMGIWIGEDTFINDKQFDDMRDLLNKYPETMFDSIFVGNEVLYREDKSVDELASLITRVKDHLHSISYERIQVGTSELGSLVNNKILDVCDFVSVNIHPFFSGVSASEGRKWTIHYLKNQVLPLLGNSHDKKVVISEIGWPYTGGEYESAIANYTEMQLFLNDWICEAQNNKIYSIYFEAFDEPWKEIFYDGSQRWETNWGFFDSERQMKKNILIPDCRKDRKAIQASFKLF
ncbi:hypothetical protein BRETT_004151 [Brettanomyces bruxellensis]|uniref:glucan endo-1,3-beta-D-glucosidase n=1 Tax=Dekkera bruxellensis TaxID=5007 RepID=A0A871R9Y2_DEKBR|nr:uncharacterized protein BRETT_004151 [Brettanomyces bruxellensis]QOU18930.1 hypothetical protein BRETT_004151 [Brettanomyces bruxellensis]